MILIKKTSGSQNWCVYHRSSNFGNNPEDYYSRINQKIAFSQDTNMFNSTAPTSTVFSVGTDTDNNQSGQTYIAYLFAHNNNDGGFGPNEDQDIIKCGRYTSTGNAFEVNLGFEPQWLFVKRDSADTEGNEVYHSWAIQDSMRGFTAPPYDQSNGYRNILWANSTVAEGSRGDLSGSGNSGVQWMPTSTGFALPADSKVECNRSGNYNHVYVAIRRGSLNTPEDATKVFSVNTTGTGDNPTNVWNIGFPPDFNINTQTDGTAKYVVSRLTDGKYLHTHNEDNQQTGIADWFDNHPTGSLNLNTAWWGGASNLISWSWKRAPSYFDVVAYKGTQSARTISHNLGVVPEMMWVKNRSSGTAWMIYHSALGNQAYLQLNDTSAVVNNTPGRWNSTTPTASVFSLGDSGSVNGANNGFVAYLFATLDGISKVGSVSHTSGSATNVDCGFSSGARFVLIKQSNGTGSWYVFDTVRGIVAGNDAGIYLDNQTVQQSADWIDPLSSGFTMTSGAWNTGTYIFYAIA
jgi:hypothetical protein